MSEHLKTQEETDMENIDNGVTTEPVVETTQEPQVDYKALYEKISKDYNNQNTYVKDLKAKYQAKLTDEEKLMAERTAKEEHYKNLERELSMSKIKSKLSSRVNDAKVLDDLASKFADGDTYGALEILNKFESEKETNLRKSIEQELLAKNPATPPAGETNGEMTKAQFDKLSVKERADLKQSNYELFKKLND